MTGRRDDENGPDVPGEEPSGGSIPTDPELAEALRAAADAIPDQPRRRPAARAAGGESAAGGGTAPGAGGGSAASGGAGGSGEGDRERPGGDLEHLLDEEIEAGVSPEVVYALRDELAETNDRLVRLQADFDNFRKRALKERQEAVQYGSQNLFKDLLSVVDNLDRAIGHARESGGGDLETFLQGVDLVRRELIGVFGKHHVTEIEALGKPFDPALHEAMAQVEDDSVPPNTVVEVLQKGFALRDRLVRPARVVVAKAAQGAGP